MDSDRRLRSGFALPAVLAVTGIVTIVFLVAMTALSSLNAEAASARSRILFAQAAMTAEAEIAYVLATEPRSARGINIGATRSFDESAELPPTGGGATLEGGPAGDEIRLDGRPYMIQARRPLTASLQDQAGMINLAFLSAEQTTGLARRLGSDGDVSRTLWARYRDYVDADALRQTGGAERAEYAARAGQGPPNRNLRRVDEWLSVLGVRQAVSPPLWRAMRPMIAVDHNVNQINVNTASASTMEVVFGATPVQAEAAIRSREQLPFVSFEQFAAAAGIPVAYDPEISYTFPANRVVATIRDTASPWTYRARITLTPADPERPVWIDQTDMLEAPRRQAAETKNVPGFPYTPR